MIFGAIIAYELKSYRVGLLVARCMWYIENGTDNSLKSSLSDILKKYYVESDNAEFIENYISGILPPVTLICNIEYQTKRKFYSTIDDFIEKQSTSPSDEKLQRLMKVIKTKNLVCDYLTRCDGSVSFVREKDCKEYEYLDFWQRVRNCNHLEIDNDLTRAFERNINMEKQKRKLISDVAGLSILRNSDFTIGDNFNTDLSDVICCLNDNDRKPVIVDTTTGDIMDMKYSKDYIFVKAKRFGSEKQTV